MGEDTLRNLTVSAESLNMVDVILRIAHILKAKVIGFFEQELRGYTVSFKEMMAADVASKQSGDARLSYTILAGLTGHDQFPST
jgi:hypothetical protein